MGLFSKSKKENIPANKEGYARVLNYIKIDAINGKPLETFFWEYSKQKKGIFAGKLEIIYLEEGAYEVFAHGVTYQTKTTQIHIAVEAGKNYILGAGVLEDDTEGLYFEER
ncbi:hypothetical protein M4I21_05085 [Cellulophaga sp. 20_2_10]|uniref:hypothetical protein n=1 Tax=Cellulophaga sp. 20_2_10 TaxID=2942476 RepID=UPI00201A9B53|nr:hypothetical protein [Cellulophaga sp. 20_2_10]MCL5245172.1 hypothetical protein [Cellulophaga sp. 20_2_10]